ncbi:hypothetical protein AAMO2058_000801300 [Amorphochlora amoebiformis]
MRKFRRPHIKPSRGSNWIESLKKALKTVPRKNREPTKGVSDSTAGAMHVCTRHTLSQKGYSIFPPSTERAEKRRKKSKEKGCTTQIASIENPMIQPRGSMYIAFGTGGSSVDGKSTLGSEDSEDTCSWDLGPPSGSLGEVMRPHTSRIDAL